MNQPASRTLLLLRRLLLAVSLLCFAELALAQTAPTPNSPSASSSAPAIAVSQTDSTGHSVAESADAGSQLTTSEPPLPAEAAANPADTKPDPAAGTPVLLSPTAQIPPEKSKYDVTQIGHRNVGNGLNFYSLEREIAFGQDLAKLVERSSRMVTDPDITAYVNRIGQNLVRNSDSRVPFTIKVIDSGEVNAFALPGGFFYVDSGLILAADSEAELAAIMAHEIAHVAARHATKNMTKQQIWNMASIPLMFVGGPAGYAIAEIASLAVPMSFLKFSRDAEREADMLGLQYDYAAGYDPQAFIQFFERLKAEEKNKHGKIAKLFSTHPMTADRITAAQTEISTYFPDRDSYVIDTSEFATMKARLVALQSGHNMLTVQSPNRPVLRNHTDDAPSTAPQSGPSPTSTSTAQTDDDRPTIKRTNPNPD